LNGGFFLGNLQKIAVAIFACLLLIFIMYNAISFIAKALIFAIVVSSLLWLMFRKKRGK